MSPDRPYISMQDISELKCIQNDDGWPGCKAWQDLAMIMAGGLPTPAKRDYKMGGYPSEYKRNSPSTLAMLGLKGRISPLFVEWMMGFPIEWSALKR